MKLNMCGDTLVLKAQMWIKQQFTADADDLRLSAEMFKKAAICCTTLAIDILWSTRNIYN